MPRPPRKSRPLTQKQIDQLYAKASTLLTQINLAELQARENDSPVLAQLAEASYGVLAARRTLSSIRV